MITFIPTDTVRKKNRSKLGMEWNGMSFIERICTKNLIGSSAK
jgi:hypothetical protein